PLRSKLRACSRALWLKPSVRMGPAAGIFSFASTRVNALAAPCARRANIRDGAQGMGRSAAGGFACVAAIAALALIGHPSAAEPQGFPGKPVRIIVPYTPGSPNDVVARLLAQHLQGKLGQAIVIDNKPGGGTTIGSKTAAVAPPDGYTLLFASSALVIE